MQPLFDVLEEGGRIFGVREVTCARNDGEWETGLLRKLLHVRNRTGKVVVSGEDHSRAGQSMETSCELGLGQGWCCAA